MAWEVKKPKANITEVCQWLHGWTEESGFYWEWMTPREVKLVLMERDGLSAVAADEYLDRLHGTEAGSLMFWCGQRDFHGFECGHGR